MLSKIFLLSILVLCVYGQEEVHPAPEPYSFTYESPNEDGSSNARQETGDANGRITGFYIIKGLDGQDRRVDYVADETGFHAEVSTSEIGTVNHEASEALYRSSAPSIADLIAQWETSGAAAAAAARRQELTASGLSAAAAGRTTIRESILSTIQPITTAAKVTETIQTSSIPAPQITPEGYVLVPASAARSAGLPTVGSEIGGLQSFNLTRANTLRTFTTETKPIATTTTTISGTRFASGVTSGLTSGIASGVASNSFEAKPEASNLRFTRLRQK